MPSATGKGDVAGQKARWRERVRQRLVADVVFRAAWREQRRQQKARATARHRRGDSAGQWTFDREGGPTLCRGGCGTVISDNALYCATARCDPNRRAKRKRMLSQ